MNKTDQVEPAQESNEGPVTSRYSALRVWPAVLLVSGMLAARWAPGFIEDGPAWIWMVSAFGPLLCGLFIMLWWVMGSRANWLERVVGIIGLIGAATVAIMGLHKTMLGPGAMIVTIPLGTAA